MPNTTNHNTSKQVSMKNKIITISFLLCICGLFIVNLAKPSQELSYSERRRLAQFPKFSVKTLMNADYMRGIDKYAVDQFVGREWFRSVKVAVDRNAFRKLDTNGLFRIGEDIFSIEYPLNEDKVIYLTSRLNAVYEKYLKGMNIYYTIIPDKNYHLSDNGQYLIMDYDRLTQLVQENMMKDAKYINLYDALSLDNYYNTDGHWRQETLKPIVDTLYEAMGIEIRFIPGSYEQKSYEPFYGAYYGQSAATKGADVIKWLENDVTRDAKVVSLGHNNQEDLPIYYEEGLGGMDSYDVFLYGAQPLITLVNTHYPQGKELLLFRDSYGSSIAPIMLEAYSKITLIDLRYITQELLGEFVEFNGQDVLFMYSSTIANNSDIIR